MMNNKKHLPQTLCKNPNPRSTQQFDFSKPATGHLNNVVKISKRGLIIVIIIQSHQSQVGSLSGLKIMFHFSVSTYTFKVTISNFLYFVQPFIPLPSVLHVLADKIVSGFKRKIETIRSSVSQPM